MNVYDFDKTIYDGDSTIDFYLYILKKKPAIIRYFVIQIYGFLKYILRISTKLEFKEKFYSFLNGVDNIDELIESFWNINEYKIKSWYLANKKSSDLIISASPEFLLEHICSKLEIQKLIASKVNKNTGKCEGENCYGEEKVIRFKKEFEFYSINEFYSDSLSDMPLSRLASQKYIVNGNQIIPWNEYRLSTIKKVKKFFWSREFFTFLIIGCVNALNGILFSYIYSIFLGVNISFIAGYITSLTISYVLNSLITFNKNLKFIRYIKFCISNIPNFIIQNTVVIAFYNIFMWNKLIVFSLAAIIGVPITFILIKFFTFKK